MLKEGTLYSMHPGFAMVETSKRNIEERTGKTYEEWIEIVKREGPEAEKDQLAWLKTEHGFGMNYAMWIVEGANGRTPENYDPDSHVDAQYRGKKEALRPIYDELLSLGLSLAPDVKACPCLTMVPLYRKNVFAQIKATTNSRIDLGLCLRGVEATGRLIDTGGSAKGDRITHRIAISSLEDIDSEVRLWLKQAYEANGS